MNTLFSFSFRFNGHFSRWTWVSWNQNISILHFIRADGGGGDNWSHKTYCEASVTKQTTPDYITIIIINNYSLSLSLSILTVISRWTWVSRCLLKRRMWRWWWQLDYWSYKSCKAPVKSSPPTNQHPVFHRPDALPVAQPTVSKHWMEIIMNTWIWIYRTVIAIKLWQVVGGRYGPRAVDRMQLQIHIFDDGIRLAGGHGFPHSRPWRRLARLAGPQHLIASRFGQLSLRSRSLKRVR